MNNSVREGIAVIRSITDPGLLREAIAFLSDLQDQEDMDQSDPE